jgi:hypothetical protein
MLGLFYCIYKMEVTVFVWVGVNVKALKRHDKVPQDGEWLALPADAMRGI